MRLEIPPVASDCLPIRLLHRVGCHHCLAHSVHRRKKLREPPPMRTAAFFDLDKTIIAKSSTLAFGRSFYQGGLINRRAVLKTAYAQFVYLVGGADHDQMERMRQYLSALCTG